MTGGAGHFHCTHGMKSLGRHPGCPQTKNSPPFLRAQAGQGRHPPPFATGNLKSLLSPLLYLRQANLEAGRAWPADPLTAVLIPCRHSLLPPSTQGRKEEKAQGDGSWRRRRYVSEGRRRRHQALWAKSLCMCGGVVFCVCLSSQLTGHSLLQHPIFILKGTRGRRLCCFSQGFSVPCMKGGSLLWGGSGQHACLPPRKEHYKGGGGHSPVLSFNMAWQWRTHAHHPKHCQKCRRKGSLSQEVSTSAYLGEGSTAHGPQGREQGIAIPLHLGWW